MVWQRRETFPLSPRCLVQGLVAADQSAVEGVWVGAHTGRFRARLLFLDERATPAVMNFLREAEVGRGRRRRERGAGLGTRRLPPFVYISPSSFLSLCIYLLRLSFACVSLSFLCLCTYLLCLSLFLRSPYSLRRDGMEEKGQPQYDDMALRGLVNDYRTGQ